MLANALLRGGDSAAARASYERAYELAVDAGAPGEMVDALNGLAALAWYGGDEAEADATWRRALDTATRWDLVQHRAVLLNNLGELAVKRGDRAPAASLLDRAEALHRHLGSDEGLADGLRLQAELALAGGEPERARALAEEASRHAEASGSPYFQGRAHRTLARAHAALAAPAERVASHLTAAASLFTRAGLTGESQETRRLAAELGVELPEELDASER